MQMLLQLGIVFDPATSNLDSVFNDSMWGMERLLTLVWANNGDMISLCYAHTSALKGDFVRTGKRDLSGMVSPSEITIDTSSMTVSVRSAACSMVLCPTSLLKRSSPSCLGTATLACSTSLSRACKQRRGQL